MEDKVVFIEFYQFNFKGNVVEVSCLTANNLEVCATLHSINIFLTNNLQLTTIFYDPFAKSKS